MRYYLYAARLGILEFVRNSESPAAAKHSGHCWFGRAGHFSPNITPRFEHLVVFISVKLLRKYLFSPLYPLGLDLGEANVTEKHGLRLAARRGGAGGAAGGGTDKSLSLNPSPLILFFTQSFLLFHSIIH